MLFFPAASLYAALLVPLSLWAMFHRPDLLPSLNSGLGHARELLFGFALAVVAGYLLGPMPPYRLAALFLLWLGARVSYLLIPSSLLPSLLGAAFAVMLGALLLPRFRTARKWRNRLLAPLLLLICLLAVMAFGLAYTKTLTGLRYAVVHQAVLLLALLMLFMGGRVVAPAMAGYRLRRGEAVGARVQPRIEGLIMTGMLFSVLLSVWPSGRPWAGWALAGTGLLALVRLLRWQLWRCARRPDLLCLGIGYGWLAAGLLSNGTAQGVGQATPALLHIITLGALGTLTGVVMLRTAILQAAPRTEADLGRERIIVAFTLLIGMATLLRLAAPLVPGLYLPLLWAAALAWSLAWLLAVWRLWLAVGMTLQRRSMRRAEA
ncbi:NnrS family protein [Halomonas shantousis]